ncbi:MAG TPA: dihydrofolate reductase family protein, partial [Candidatus Angelobacter sp.]|nr:dihydrofolate reductase family protein [Candidatus Angelobacter sp.]
PAKDAGEGFQKTMRDFQILFDDSEPSALDHPAYAPYGNLGFPAPHADRPWTYANFVQSIDGVASFKGKHAAGSDISQSDEDRWLMDLLRAHADAILMGVNTLMEETLSAPQLNGGRGPVYRIEEEALRDLRTKLGRAAEKVIFVTASAVIDPRGYRVFDGDAMQAFVLTTAAGAARLKARDPRTPVIVSGDDKTIDLPKAMQILRAEMGIRYLLCEGGPTLYGSMARAGLIDEKFVTVSPVEVGLMAPEQEVLPTAKAGGMMNLRPTTFMFPGFSKENAPWYRWMSCRRVGDHQFNRYRRT